MPTNILENHLFPDNSKKEIQEELDRILSSDMFSRSSVLSNFLKFIVDETLNGNTDELKEYVIAVNALGKSSDFNPQIDAIVRIHAGRLRRLMNEYYRGPGITNPLRIEVVKGTYVPVFRSHVIHSLREDTNEETKTTTKSDSKVEPNLNDSNAPKVYSRSKLTLAILPFRNLCPENEYQFFVDGFGEELTRIFSTFEHVSVVSHHSTLKYANIHEDVRVIGSDLGAHYLINGSVKRSDKIIRVNIGLIESMNGIQIWSKTYTHDLDKDEIMEIQDRIDHDVFSILSGQFGFILKDSMDRVKNEMKQNLQSFDAILWNYYAQMTHSMEDCQKSRNALENAIQKDPDNVMCLLVLGDTYLYAYSLGYPTIADPINEALKLIKKALRLSPHSQYANMIHGWVNIYLGNKEEALKALEYSMQLGLASASADGQIGFGMACIGAYKRSKVLLKKSIDLNPYCPWWYYLGFFLVSYHYKNYNEALMYALKINVSDDVFLGPLLRTAAMGQLGMILEAQTDVKTLNEKFEDIMANLDASLNTFLLDQALIDDIVQGVKKAGVNMA